MESAEDLARRCPSILFRESGKMLQAVEDQAVEDSQASFIATENFLRLCYPSQPLQP